MTALEFYQTVWLKEHADNVGGDWPFRFAEAYAAARASVLTPQPSPGNFTMCSADIGKISVVTLPPQGEAPAKCPGCEATNIQEAAQKCIPVEGECPMVEAGFYLPSVWPTQYEFDRASVAASAPADTTKEEK